VELEGKAAIVTGSSTGVGRETALGLARRGCSVLVNYAHSKDEAEKTAAGVEKLGVAAVLCRADVSDDAACVDMVAQATAAFGRLDVLVNNAGTTTFVPHGNLDGLSGDDWDTILAVNLKGPFFCSRAVVPEMRKQGGGEIVMTSSVAGLVGTGSSIAYCASKAGVNNLTVTLGRALAPDRIRVNAVAPGFIAGSWLEQGLGPAYPQIKQAMEDKTPLGAVATPEEVARVIVDLIAGSDLITGHVIPVEGGMLIAQ
jgi:3-oxoacyl-[acyl-carrier protein] reductase